MAQWNLKIAAQLLRVMKKKHPAEIKKVVAKIHIKYADFDTWRQVAANLYIPFSKKTKILEQFEGFLKRRKLPLTDLDQNSMPVYPESLRDIGSTQYVKQADVVMILFILSDLFSFTTKQKNYLFYEKRTLHKSSLSASIHALVGAEVGEEHKASHYFDVASHADLKNIYGNTDDGIHAASLGGVWQALINGFAGMRIRRGILSFSPRLPSAWKRVKFQFKFKGYVVSADVGQEKVTLSFSSKRKTDQLPVRIYRTLHTLKANKKLSVYKKRKKKVTYDTRGLY
jgi:kojibiose phosphorylase